jgi:hypothetical protein
MSLSLPLPGREGGVAALDNLVDRDSPTPAMAGVFV